MDSPVTSGTPDRLSDSSRRSRCSKVISSASRYNILVISHAHTHTQTFITIFLSGQPDEEHLNVLLKRPHRPHGNTVATQHSTMVTRSSF